MDPQKHEANFQTFRLQAAYRAKGALFTSKDEINIIIRRDPTSGRRIVLWHDIVGVFAAARCVQSGETVLPFLSSEGSSEYLEPRRIEAHPDVVLDVIL
ncbi:hypothetical protein BGX30_010811 [Mortierella sp. GBA39]|nr:hypothetical protein BGX30_010811 [Mortierella sp. GBA39]